MPSFRKSHSTKQTVPRLDEWGRGALFYCESAKAVNEVFRSPHTDCAAPDRDGWLPIHRACFLRNAEVIKALGEHGTPTRRRVDEYTPAILLMKSALEDLDDIERTVECFKELLRIDPQAGMASTTDGRCARDFLHTSGQRKAHDLSRAPRSSCSADFRSSSHSENERRRLRSDASSRSGD